MMPEKYKEELTRVFEEEKVFNYDHADYTNWVAEWWEEPEETKACHSCFGTGMDKYEDADCLVCYGDGVV